MPLDHQTQTYRDEATELLAELESSLLELLASPGDMEIVARVFRAMHTIKGSGAMFGFNNIALFTHQVETVYDLVREGKVKVTQELVNLTLKARDQISAMLHATEEVDLTEDAAATALMAAFRAYIPEELQRVAGAKKNLKAREADTQRRVTYRIQFRPHEEIYKSGSNPLFTINDALALGDARIIVRFDRLPSLADFDPESCYISWDIILTTDRSSQTIEDIFEFYDGEDEVQIDLIDDTGALDTEADYKRLGDILVERGDISLADLRRALGEKKRIGELLVASGLVSDDTVNAALAEQQYVKEIREKKQVAESISSVRVPADKLDHLVNLVGELVTAQARLTQTAAYRNDAELISIAEEVERLTSELRDSTLNVRMLTIGTTFGKFKRLIHDLSTELGKEINFETEGADTELDKTVIEKLGDPLVHLIRNSIDHGIELPADRRAAGKTAEGTIRLSAIHAGGAVLIRIEDDGKGLNREKIRAKAIERGLIASDQNLSDKDIYALIVEPGFSTADKVTNLSGRGVGMDVVKRAIDALRGTLDIESTDGAGTTITLKIPLTLAIIESLLVSVGESRYVMPLSMIEECVELTPADIERAHGRQMAHVRGAQVPYVNLREIFSVTGNPPEIQQVVIGFLNGMRVGFTVDAVIGEHQTVIKSLGRVYREVKGVSGATVLGDGTVALILDLAELYRAAERMELDTTSYTIFE